jgi:methanol metabolism-related c-type cytochrome
VVRGFLPRPLLISEHLERDVVKYSIGPVALSAIALLFSIAVACADGSGNPAAVTNKDGRYYDKDGNPTFKVQADGTVDWATYSGFRRYHSECHVCHGPDGEGSSYAPALKESLKRLSYPEFLSIVATGRQNVNTASENVMPAFGENKNVVCYLDDIYTYLRARANDAIGRGRPAKHENKPEAASKAENNCMGVS